MEMFGKVRRMYSRDRLTRSEIARRPGLPRTMVKKWLRAPEGTAPKYRWQGVTGKLTPIREKNGRARFSAGIQSDPQLPWMMRADCILYGWSAAKTAARSRNGRRVQRPTLSPTYCPPSSSCGNT